MTEATEAALITLAILANEPMDKMLPADPIEPTLNTLFLL